MELFYGKPEGPVCVLDKEESVHCIKVLRHRCGDEIHVVDGAGNMYRCSITTDSPKAVEALILETVSNWNAHDYRLTAAVCPSKNHERYDWFAEKAAEMGVDCIVPVIGRHSERKDIRKERLERLLVSAMKQSQKALLPVVGQACGVEEFIRSCSGSGALRIIACCSDDVAPRRNLMEVLRSYGQECPEIVFLVGPEGDFASEEVSLAVQEGFIPVTLGPSILRIETAALLITAAVYMTFQQAPACS